MSSTSLQLNTALPSRIRRVTGDRLRAGAFWAAVLLPLTYLPVLHGIVVESSAELFLLLLALNVVAAVLGHDHSPRADADTQHRSQTQHRQRATDSHEIPTRQSH